MTTENINKSSHESIVKSLESFLINKGYSSDKIKIEYPIDNFIIDLAVVENDKILEVYEIKTEEFATKLQKSNSFLKKFATRFSEYATAYLVWIDSKNELAFKSLKDDNNILSNSTVESFNSFYKLLRKHFIDDESEVFQYFFRGHASNKYEFKPSIYRSSSTTKGIEDEDLIFKEAIRKCPSDFPNHLSTFEKLVKMQHYELPTRLLDITTNPLVALFFACNGSKDEDGEVIIFKVKKSDIKFYDSDAISVVANIARRPKTFKIPPYTNKISFNNSSEIQYLLHEIKYEKPHFQDVIVPSDVESVFCVLPKLDNPRIVKQAGAFFIFGIDKEKNNHAQFKLTPRRITINARGKKKILKELSLFDINESTLFPEIDKILHGIKQK